MNLHRAEKVPDWEKMEPSERSLLQRIAAKTRGILTPGNVITAVGGICVASGLIDVHKGKTLRGVIKIGVGRGLDIVDGIAADKTKTKSPLGEAFDASVDKICMAAMVGVFYKRGIITKNTALHIAGQNVLNAAVTGVAKLTGKEIHPSAAGKHAMLLQGGTIGMAGLATAAHEENNQELAHQLGKASEFCEYGAAILGTIASIGYVKTLFRGGAKMGDSHLQVHQIENIESREAA